MYIVHILCIQLYRVHIRSHNWLVTSGYNHLHIESICHWFVGRLEQDQGDKQSTEHRFAIPNLRGKYLLHLLNYLYPEFIFGKVLLIWCQIGVKFQYSLHIQQPLFENHQNHMSWPVILEFLGISSICQVLLVWFNLSEPLQKGNFL